MNNTGTAFSASSGTGTRIFALDALRGLAVIGIVPMNVLAFSMPPAAYFNPRVHGGDGLLETLLWAVSFLLVEDKFRALFAMMFGAGVAILLGKAGAHPLRDHYARMLALFAIAMVHAIMLANNDVLRSYAVAGLLLPLAVNWQVRTLLWSAAAIMAAQLAVSGWFAWDWILALGNPEAEAVAEATYGVNSQAFADAAARADWSIDERVTNRLGQLPQQAIFVAASLPSALASMLVGIALWRNGLLEGRWEKARALGLAIRCAIVALPALAGLCVWAIHSGFNAIVTTANALVWSAPFDLLLGIGWAALAMAIFADCKNALVKALCAAGRLALTNYLLTSVIFAMLFMAWGFDLFGGVSRGQALLLGLIPVGLMLVWSPLWLAQFRQGPCEWLWRSLAAGRLQPIRGQVQR